MPNKTAKTPSAIAEPIRPPLLNPGMRQLPKPIHAPMATKPNAKTHGKAASGSGMNVLMMPRGSIHGTRSKPSPISSRVPVHLDPRLPILEASHDIMMLPRAATGQMRPGPQRGRRRGRRRRRSSVGVVAAVLVAGSEKAAAHRLGLSHSTVKHHLANARSKVGAETDSGDDFFVRSAGTEQTRVNPYAVRALASSGSTGPGRAARS